MISSLDLYVTLARKISFIELIHRLLEICCIDFLPLRAQNRFILVVSYRLPLQDIYPGNLDKVERSTLRYVFSREA